MALRDLNKKRKPKPKKDFFIESYQVGKEIKGKYKDILFSGILKKLGKSTYIIRFPSRQKQTLIAFDIEFKEALPYPVGDKESKEKLPKTGKIFFYYPTKHNKAYWEGNNLAIMNN